MKPTRYSFFWSLFLGTLALLLAGRARAQSGPYGNEWIVPGQTYYKIQTTQDGIYRLDYAYLTKAGLGAGTDLNRLQLWRRGKEVAISVAGAALDAGSRVEFFGQRNDAALDRGMFKRASDQAQPYFSLYTDTAAYFLTIGAAPGKRMAPATAGTAAPAPYWLKSELRVQADRYQDVDSVAYLFQSWAEANEGFFSGNTRTGTSAYFAVDSIRRVAADGPDPRIEMQLVGGSRAPHAANLFVLQPQTQTWRQLGSVSFAPYTHLRIGYNVQRTDVGTDGKVTIRMDVIGTQTVQNNYDFIRLAYLRVVYPQTAGWVTRQNSAFLIGDSTSSNPISYYALDGVPPSVRGFDVTDAYNVQYVAGSTVGGSTQRGFGFSNSTILTRRYLLSDTDKPLVPPAARRVYFRTYQPTAADFLIISSPVLMHPADGLTNPVRAYADYRASAAGGKHDTLVVTTRQLIDQFHYGEKSVLALRHFTLWMLSDKSREKYLLLLGKGYFTGEGGFFTRNNPGLDLVPACTRAGSDIFLSADWSHNNYTAGIATGRVSAQTPDQVAAYLSKLKEHEALGLEPWRLNALNIVGGEDQAQFEQFQGYANTYKQEIESPCFQGKVVKTYTKSTIGNFYTLPVNINIAKELNAGLSLITYFGHGAFYNFDLNIGYINDPVNGYANKGKYPVMFYNGCVAGNAFATGLTISVDWVLAANKGAVGFMAESGFGFDTELNVTQSLLYKILLNEPAWFGKPVASAWNEVARRLQPTRDDPYLASTLMGTVWQGDPALRLFAPAKPDLVITNDSLQLQAADNQPILASSPSFKLVIRAGNLGSGCGAEKVDVCVTRKYPTTAGRADDAYSFSFPTTQRNTTFTVDIPNAGNVFGENTFIVKLDCNNQIDELSETNNEGQLKYNFLQGGVSLLSPPEFAIVPSPAVRLVGQTNIAGADARDFAMELDTVPTFNSTLVQRTTVTGRLLAEWQPTLPALAGRDSVVWYWRLRLQTPQAGESDAWATSSFRVIKGSAGGWSQSHYGQFQRDARQRLNVTAPAGRWDFGDTPLPITVRTQGASGANTFQSTYGITFDGNSPFIYNCGLDQPGLLVTVYDGRTLRPVRTVPGAYDSCGTAPTSFYRFNGINDPARQTQLVQLLSSVPAGDYVAAVSVNQVNFTGFSAELKAAFAGLGSQLMATLQDGDPFAFVGQKGPNPHPVQEQTYDPNGTGGRYEQIVTLNGALRARGGSGVVTSTLIGPAQQWTTLFHTVRSGATGSYTLRVLGVDANGKATELNPDVKSRDFSLADVSAQQYPYLQLQLQVRDTLNRLAPQLRQWLVTYQGVPEGVVRPDLAAADAYTAATLTRQAASGYITVPVKFENVSGLDFGTPLKAEITLRDAANRTSTTLVEYKGGVLKAGETATIEAKASVIDLASGVVTGSVNVNPRLLPEQYYYNNELVLPPFTVTNNSAPPVLDVAFDGQHILNGDIVSPAPVVTVQLQNNNLLRPIKDPNSFSVFLLRPGATTPEQVSVTSSAVVFSADSAKGTARIEYRPGKAAQLADGVYTLIAQGRDAAGTVAGTQEYRVQFEVITASTITHLYPYPNPVTSKTRFVFTLTGAEMPRNLKIQILSLTGRVVREIMMAELGPLHIGNNISDYAWDGTDEYGDRLANGTYLYRVVMDDPGSQFARRATAGDKAFQKDWGKLVLLR